jgi:hypothetical protein
MEHSSIDGRSDEVISCSDSMDVTSEVKIKLQKSRSHLGLPIGLFQLSFYCNPISPYVNTNGLLTAAWQVDKCPRVGAHEQDTWPESITSQTELVVFPK